MCGGPKWKREEVTDHKFDFIDTRDFIDNGFVMRVKYLWLYLVVLKSFLVYISDIFSATTMLTTKSWSNEIFNECANTNQCIFIPFDTGKWLFVGCIIFGFLLLAYESRKSKRIIASRDISYAFTNVMANNYYSLRSYSHFCFFDHISNSTKLSDDFAFFVFFVFKSWKRLLLADGPRQTINALTLYAIYVVKSSQQPGNWYDVSRYFAGSSFSTAALTVTTFFTVAVFAGSLLLLIVAAICYIPLLCHIRGNLKEYCCHKVDKRIEEVITRQRDKRLQETAKLEQKEARGDFSHLKNKKGAKPLPQPTLPNLSVDDDDDASSMRTRGPPPSTYTQDNHYYQDQNYPPPMPAYNPYSHHQRDGSGAHFEGSQAHLAYDDPSYQQHYAYDDDNESTAHLAVGAAPFGHQPQFDRPGSARPYATSPAPAPTGYDMQGPYQNQYGSTHPTHVQQSSLAYSQGTSLPYDDRYGSVAQQHENPYGGYPNHEAHTQQPPRRAYDEENRGGGYAM
ncbi:hypothetical protein BDN72DRAFT_809920 [Pluteus cervinus]|uniref:Uncharacterized protein n=1 Tax=Pluteus cervinus TaxID=181527 RepID=A0ACD3BDS5_9AGAR|nr:hypothetical protein BDN72DRAFT_809920 [Pluteus cervinus]